MRAAPGVLERVLRGILISVAVLTIVLIAFAAHFRELSDTSALEIAQVARNVADGKGYTTLTPTPLSLSMVTRVEDHPELNRPPAYVATLAGVMRLFGATDRIAALTSTFFLVLCVGAVYLLGTRLFGPTTGVISMLVFVSLPGALGVAVTATEGAFLALLITVLFLVFLAWREYSESRGTLLAAAVGLICAIAYLTRPEMVVFLAVALLFIALHSRKRALPPMLIALLVFAVAVTPWLWRTYQLTGTPIASLGSYDLVTRTSFKPDALDTMFRVPDMHPIREAVSQPVAMGRKFVRLGLEYYHWMPRMFNGYLTALFIVGLPLAIARRRHGLLHVLLVVAAVFVAVILALYGQVNAVVMSLVPVATVFAIGWMVQLTEDAVASFYPARNGGDRESVSQQWMRPRFGVTLVALTLFLMTPLWPFLFHNTPPHTTPITTFSETLVDRPERVLVSDISSHLAWHTGKIVVPLPRSPATLELMKGAGLPIDALYLSPGALRLPPSQRFRPWLEWLSDDDVPATPMFDQELPGMIWHLSE